MIKAKTGVTIVTLSLGGSALTLVQTGTGSLKHGDNSSATKLLTSVRDGLLRHVESIKTLVSQGERMIASLTGSGISAAMVNEGRTHVAASKKLLETFNQELAEVEQILVYAKQYDTEMAATNGSASESTTATAQAAAQAAEKINLEELVDAVLGKMFGNPTQPNAEKIVIGCGEEGCPGCGGHKVFEFNPESLFGGLRKQSDGIRGTDQTDDLVKALRQRSRSGFRVSDLAGNIPEGLRKAMQSGQVRIINIADRDEEAEGLVGLMEHIFNTSGARSNRSSY